MINSGDNNNDIVNSLRSSNIPLNLTFNNIETINQLFGRISLKIEADSLSLVKIFSDKDFLLLSGDPKVIGLAIAVACDINNGKYTTLTWDRQEKMYYPTEFNIHERGEIDESNRL